MLILLMMIAITLIKTTIPQPTTTITMTKKGTPKHNNNPIPGRAVVQCALLLSIQM